MAKPIKAKSLFDHLKDLHTKSNTWDNLSEADRKSFSVFMINRFLSMNPDYTAFINDLQETTFNVEPKFVYMIYQTVLPKSNGFYHKYIKATNEKSYNKDLVSLFSNYIECSKSEITEWFNILPDLQVLRPILKQFALGEKEIDKMLKVSKDEE